MHRKATMIVPIMIIAVIIALPVASASTVENAENIEGTTTIWKFDVDLDDENDGELVMENVTGSDPSTMTCTLTAKNYTTEGIISLTGAPPEWDGMQLFVTEYNDTGEFLSGIYCGMPTEVFMINITINGNNFTMDYNKETGLLMSVYSKNHTDISYYMMIEKTDTFFNASVATPVITVIFIAITGVTVAFIIATTARDKSIRSKRACFDDGCLDGE
jgi:hypothetical protein